MKSIDLYIVPAYYNLLNGAITVEGEVLPVYDGQVDAAYQGSYILIGEISSSQTPGKTCLNFEVFVLIDVCIKGPSFGFKDADEATNQIFAIINPSANPNCYPDFQVVSTSLQSSNRLPGINATDNFFRRLSRFRHLVTEL